MDTIISAVTPHRPHEPHLIDRVGWLRAAVLGANDGILSTSSLMVGVASAAAAQSDILLAGVAGISAGALSMAAGEYVSVSSQRDTEKSEMDRESAELRDYPEAELEELTQIYVARGVDENLARQVAQQMTSKDALGTHMRDELGVSEMTTARPIQAALASAAAFTSGALLPLLTAVVTPHAFIIPVVSAASLVFLALLGAVGAKTGGSPLPRAILRVTFWGAIAMAATAIVGKIFGVAV